MAESADAPAVHRPSAGPARAGLEPGDADAQITHAQATDGAVIDTRRVGGWLGRPMTLEGPATTGSSNATWYVVVDGEPAVLRHPPTGDILPTAHDVAREHRYIAALAGTGVPVPEVVAFCDDADVIGVPFLITARIDAVCLLQAHPTVVDPRRLVHDAIDVLGRVHAVDWNAVGLSAPPGRYVERQVRRWREQLRRTPTAARLGDLDRIYDWLLAHLPCEEESTIVHGDYGFHNLLVDPGSSRVSAVLDWELATIGDPLSDVVSFTKGWGPDAAPPNPANRSFRAPDWEPTRDELVGWYEAATGRALGPNIGFYEVFGRWRSIGIMEGIFARTDGSRFGDDVPRLVERTMTLIEAG
jgi:aminoglycoside phosphotransferase (APT) family kinase protein